MKVLVACLLVLHGLIHFMGFAKAFKYAELAQLKPIAPGIGAVWLLTALLFLLTAGLLFAWPRGWWVAGLIAVCLSTWVIALSWSVARFGMVANLLILIAIVVAIFTQGPLGLRAQYEADVELGRARLTGQPIVLDADLAPLPAAVQRYLRLAGVVGRPRVQSVRARMHGRIRSGPDSRWMPLTADQVNFFDDPARFFYMDASMFGLPIPGYHRYSGTAATMRVKVLGIVRVADAAGDAMTQAETVTFFNDMCVLAPATLVSSAIRWEGGDARIVRASFTNAGHTIHAELHFDDSGALVNFVSDDRQRGAGDGFSPSRAVRWSTPVGRPRSFDGVTLASHGEGRWHDPAGEFTYIEIEIDDVRYN